MNSKSLPRFRVFVFAALGFGVFGLGLHIFLKDRIPGLAVAFYLLPLPLLSLLFVPEAIVQFFKGNRAFAGLYGLLIASCWVWSYHSALFEKEVQFADSNQSVSAMLWTADHYKYGSIESIYSQAESQQAEIIALIEGFVNKGEQEKLAKVYFPEYQVRLLRYGMVFLFKGEILKIKSGTVGQGKGEYNIVETQMESGERLVVCLYDQKSNLLYSRGPSLNELAALLRAYESENVLLMGDFNTPPNSLHFNALRDFMQPAHRQTIGMMQTWPAFFPVATLDQVWFGENLQLFYYRNESTSLSLHRPVLFELTFR